MAGNTWWLNNSTGKLRRSATSPGPGWTGYANEKDALKAALTWGFDHTNNQLFPGVSSTPGQGPLNNMGDFFHRLTEKETWVRVGEVALGAILLYAGVRASAQGTAVASAAKSAAKPVKGLASVAAPEARLARRAVAKKAAPKTTARVTAHRAQVAKHGQRKPYSPSATRPPATRVSHVYHHKAVKP